MGPAAAAPAAHTQDGASSASVPEPYVVPPELIAAFKRDGVVVLPGVFTVEEVAAARAGMAVTLAAHGVVRGVWVRGQGAPPQNDISFGGWEGRGSVSVRVLILKKKQPTPTIHPLQDVDDLESTAGNLRALSSTGGSGGVLDRYYMPWKLEMAQNPRFFQAISQLWAATFAAAPAPDPDDPNDHARVYGSHPFGPFDPSKGYFYMDRVGFRVPDRIAERHRKGKRPLQRSLTPHLDCCPSALYDSGKREGSILSVVSTNRSVHFHFRSTHALTHTHDTHNLLNTFPQKNKQGKPTHAGDPSRASSRSLTTSRRRPAASSASRASTANSTPGPPPAPPAPRPAARRPASGTLRPSGRKRTAV